MMLIVPLHYIFHEIRQGQQVELTSRSVTQSIYRSLRTEL